MAATEKRDKFDPWSDPDEFAEAVQDEESRSKRVEMIAKRTANRLAKETFCGCKELGGKVGYRHRKGCPEITLTDEQRAKLVMPLAKEIAELEVQKSELHEQLANLPGPPGPVYLGINDHFLWFPTENSPRDLADRAWREIMMDVAKAMGAQLVWRNAWRATGYEPTRYSSGSYHEGPQEPLPRPLLKPNPRYKKGDPDNDQKETLVVLGVPRDLDWYAVFPSEHLARSYVRAMKMMERLLRLLHDVGLDHGRSLVVQLAQGKISFDSMNKKVVEALKTRGKRKPDGLYHDEEDED